MNNKTRYLKKNVVFQTRVLSDLKNSGLTLDYKFFSVFLFLIIAPIFIESNTIFMSNKYFFYNVSFILSRSPEEIFGRVRPCGAPEPVERQESRFNLYALNTKTGEMRTIKGTRYSSAAKDRSYRLTGDIHSFQYLQTCLCAIREALCRGVSWEEGKYE